MKWLLLVTLFSLNAWADCPVGRHDEHLTIARVMQNLGRFSVKAELVTLKGMNPYETVQSEEIQEAADKLVWAIDCVDAVLANPTGPLLPTRANRLKGQEREDLIKDFLFFMEAYRDELTIYRNLLVTMLAQAAGERDFPGLDDQRKVIDALVERAHEKIMGD